MTLLPLRPTAEKKGRDVNTLIHPKKEYTKTLNNRTRGANYEYRGGPGGPGTGCCSPGGGVLVLVAVVACHYVYYH